jgi:resuscitation-promoting factor RpfA
VTNQSREDSDLDALLARKSDVSRAWLATSVDEPSVAVDDAIRAAARRAVSAGPQASRSSFAVRWRIPLSIAAVLVVSASLTVLVSEEKQHLPGMTPQDLPRAVPPQPAEPNAAPARRDEEARQVVSPRVLSDSAVLSQPTDRTAPAGKASGAMDSATNKATAPAPQVTAPAPAPQGTAVTPAAIAPTPDRAASAAQAGAAARNDSPSVDTDARANAELKQDLPSARELPSQPAAQSEAASKRKFEQEAPVPQSPEADSAAPRAPPAPARATANAQLRSRVTPAKDPASEENLAPAAWIERILDLRREGKLKEAADSLEAFRRRYPDYSLPQELSTPQ